MQSNLLTSILVIISISVIGCSTSAPKLPTDYGSTHSVHKIDKTLFSSADLKISCNHIFAEKKKLNANRSIIDKEIEDSRTSDQAMVYIFGMATMLLGSNGDIGNQLQLIQSRLDTLNLLRRYKKC